MLLHVLNKSEGAPGGGAGGGGVWDQKLKLKNCGEIQASFFSPSICCDFKWIRATLKVMFPWLDGGWWDCKGLQSSRLFLFQGESEAFLPSRGPFPFPCNDCCVIYLFPLCPRVLSCTVSASVHLSVSVLAWQSRRHARTMPWDGDIPMITPQESFSLSGCTCVDFSKWFLNVLYPQVHVL